MLLSACDMAKRRCRLYFLLPSVVSPNTKRIQQGSLHHAVQASTCLLVCVTFKIIWRFSEGTKVRSKHFFRLCQYVLFTLHSFHFWFGAKLIKIRQTEEEKAINIHLLLYTIKKNLLLLTFGFHVNILLRYKYFHPPSRLP